MNGYDRQTGGAAEVFAPAAFQPSAPKVVRYSRLYDPLDSPSKGRIRIMINRIIFLLTIFAEAVLGVSLILTLVHPKIRAWPPPGRDSWQYRLTWSLTITSMLGVLVLGILDWGSMPIPVPIRVAVGSLLMLLGLALALWAIRFLTVSTSLGLGGRFAQEGPYRFTRNPQYVGDILLIVGYIILSSSWLALITGLIGSLWFILAPFTEEPWLRERYGEEYERYLDTVPRFIGVPHLNNDAA